jgi:hypothetical protein
MRRPHGLLFALGSVLFSVGAEPMPYAAPKADGPVAVLLDEDLDALLPLLTNEGGNEPGTVVREDRDVFAGVEAARVTPLQRYAPRLPGWAYKVVENPKAAGEYRFIRFAWKKIGGTGVMVQLHDGVKQSWEQRLVGGANPAGWPAKIVSPRNPADWEVVTRDLFKEFGAMTLTGFALTPMDGEAALFDHLVLGRSVADLDRATDEALGRVKPAVLPEGKARDALWADLVGADRKRAAVALRAFLATASTHDGYVRDRLPKPDPEGAARMRRLVADLGADAFAVREAATESLEAEGSKALALVREAAGADDPEVRSRANRILRRLGGANAADAAAARIVRVLERAATPVARDTLKALAAGDHGADYAPFARAALTRLAAGG